MAVILAVIALITIAELGNVINIVPSAHPIESNVPDPVEEEKPVIPEVKPRVEHTYSDHKVINYYPNHQDDLAENEFSHSILFNVVIGSATAFGNGRSFPDLLETLLTLWKDNKQYEITLGFLVSPESDFELADAHLSELEIPGVKEITLILAPFMENKEVANAKDRHSDSLQRLRRRTLGRVRNYLMYSTMKEQDYVFFMDADVRKFDKPEQFLATLIESAAPIVVPRITNGANIDYDLNSWRGERTKPSQEQLALLDADKWLEFNYVPRDVPEKMKHIKDFADFANPDADVKKIERLDSVGGAVLFAKSAVLKQGVMFPPIYIIGTTWDRSEGYDGIETEGMCYIAKPLGYDCYAMPNLVAHHTPRG